MFELHHAAGETHTECPAPQEGDSLWEYFHRAGHALWSERQRLITPVLVFDQFEEIFTHRETSTLSARRVETLIEDLSTVVENRTPRLHQCCPDGGARGGLRERAGNSTGHLESAGGFCTAA